MYNIDLILAKTIDTTLETLASTDISCVAPLAPWEQLHKSNFTSASMLSRLTNTSLNYHLAFTKERQEIILRAHLEGNTLRTCAQIAGILPDTLKRWCQLGEKGIEPYYTFVIELNRARGLAEAKFVRDLHYTKDGKGAMYWLERQEAEDWADKSKQPTSNFNQRIELNIPLSEMKPDQKKIYIENLIEQNKKNKKSSDT